MIVHEDAVRLTRQRLLALEEGRESDAKTLEKFLSDEFGVTLIDVAVADVPADRVERWRARFGLPAGVERVTVIKEYNREPIWRIPADLETRAVSGYEVPLHLQPSDVLQPDTPDDDRPEWLRRRTAGDLPARVGRALRLPGVGASAVEPEPAGEAA